MSPKFFQVSVLFVLMVAAAARPLHADPVIIYSNFGPAPGYLDGSGYVSQGESGAYGMVFQVSQDARLASVMFPIVWGDYIAPGFQVAIFERSGFDRLDHIESIKIDTPEGAQTGQVSMLSAQSSLQPRLSASTEYLLGMFVQTRNMWPWNNAGITGTYTVMGPIAISVNSGPLSAFQVTGEPVPEPASLLLVATGAGIIARRARTRRRSASKFIGAGLVRAD